MLQIPESKTVQCGHLPDMFPDWANNQKQKASLPDYGILYRGNSETANSEHNMHKYTSTYAVFFSEIHCVGVIRYLLYSGCNSYLITDGISS